MHFKRNVRLYDYLPKAGRLEAKFSRVDFAGLDRQAVGDRLRGPGQRGKGGRQLRLLYLGGQDVSNHSRLGLAGGG
jgi:hypothetical protein